MNPTSNETPGISLPPPSEQQLAAPAVPAESALPQPAPEQRPAAAAVASNSAPAQGMPIMPPPTAPPAAAVTQAAATVDDSSTTKLTASKVLKDDDLIEKEWVNKAKQIVERTKNDPHRQSEELTLVKADYMKKHYNKTIKIEK